MGINHRTALVTGAASGIGRATALRFANEGANVIVADMHESDTVNEIRNQDGEAVFIQCDVNKEEDVRRAVKMAVDTYGRLDFACNNAGIEGEQALTADCTTGNWDKVINTNLRGLWLCMKYEIPVLLKNGGSIVNMASIAGLVGFTGMPAYVASKHGIVGLTKTAALEYAQQNIRINAVCPGGIDTPMLQRFTEGDPVREKQMQEMHPMGRTGKPHEIADVVIWLCSDESSFITGQAIAVDGGYVAR